MLYKKYFLVFFIFVLLTINLSVLISAEEEVDEGYSGKLTVSKTSGGKIIISGSGQMPLHYCGNNVLETYIGEDCDGSVNGLVCSDIDSSLTGILSCSSNCLFDTSGCSVDTTIPPTTPPTNTGGGNNNNGGSSSGSSKCVESWTCEEWGKCKDNTQTRTCSDLKKCSTTKLKPTTERGCNIEGESGDNALEINTEKSQQNFFSRITGAVIGGGSAKFVIPIIFIILIAAGTIVLYIKRNTGSKVISPEQVDAVVSE